MAAALPLGSVALADDLHAASATVSSVHGQAQDLHQRYLAAAGQASAQLDAVFTAGPWGDKDRENPFTAGLEKVHSSLDAVGIDGVLWAMGKSAALAEKFMKELPEQEQDWLLNQMREDVAAKAANPEADLDELAAQTTSRWFAKADAAEGFGEQFERDTRMLGLLSRALGSIAKTLVATDPDRAERIAQSITDHETKAHVLCSVATEITVSSPDRAVRLLTEAEHIASLIPEPARKVSVLLGIAGA